jgi:hypothetical protein
MAFSPQVNYDWVTTTGRQILMPTFVARRVSCGQHGRNPTVVNLSFLDWSRYFSFKQLLIYPHEAVWTLLQTRSYSENVVAQGIEPSTSRSAGRNSNHYTTEVVKFS